MRIGEVLNISGVGSGEDISDSCVIILQMFDFFNPDFFDTDKNRIFIMLMRDGLETVPARSHKPYHGGSNPSPATKYLFDEVG